ncbi:hypothetical protein MRB53_028735 [Persea americana]|uniref:Uncharacterized protein n=1 Tax=Persea americana TaxID=3435 RepID=A0ACC2KGI5_PERAE|nr:hypothetical protein MRB53_028735 [Persea americana]
MEINGLKANCITYNSIISGICKVNETAEVEASVREMELERGVAPNVETYNSLIDGHAHVFQFDRCLQILQEMKEKGVHPDVVTYGSLISGLCKNGKVDEAEILREDMADRGVSPNVKAYNMLIDGYCKMGKLLEAFKLLKEMTKKGIARTVGSQTPSSCPVPALAYLVAREGALMEVSKANHTNGQNLHRRGESFNPFFAFWNPPCETFIRSDLALLRLLNRRAALWLSLRSRRATLEKETAGLDVLVKDQRCSLELNSSKRKGPKQCLSLVDADLRKLSSDLVFLNEVRASYTSSVESEARGQVTVGALALPPRWIATGLGTQSQPLRAFGRGRLVGPTSFRSMSSASGPGCRRVRHAALTFVGLWVGGVLWALRSSGLWLLPPGQVAVDVRALSPDQVAAGLGTQPLPPRGSGSGASSGPYILRAHVACLRDRLPKAHGLCLRARLPQGWARNPYLCGAPSRGHLVGHTFFRRMAPASGTGCRRRAGSASRS